MNALFGLLAFAQLSTGQPIEVDGIYTLDGSVHYEITSEHAEHRYDILVGLPRGYDVEAGRRYAVVYVLDAGLHYPVLRSYHNYMINGAEVPDVIFVGVSYGTSDWQAGNNRSHDFTAPSEEREFWGGAKDYLRFLESELIPEIESTYRADPQRRVIFGQSLGGQFVLFAAQTKPEVFWGYIASNPALHRNLAFFLDASPANPDGSSRLYVATGSDDRRFHGPAAQWIEHWSSIETPPWQLKTETLDGHTHFSAPPVSYRRGIKWVFADDPD